MQPASLDLNSDSPPRSRGKSRRKGGNKGDWGWGFQLPLPIRRGLCPKELENHNFKSPFSVVLVDLSLHFIYSVVDLVFVVKYVNFILKKVIIPR